MTKYIFNEIFYRRERERWFRLRTRFLLNITLMSISICLLAIVMVIYSDVRTTNTLLFANGLFLLIFFTSLVLYSLYNWRFYWPWISIDNNGIWINFPRHRKLLDKNGIRKLIVDLKKERIIILYKGRKIVLKRDINLLQGRILSYDQFNRFKKAMETIGVKYEIIYR